MMDRVYKEDIPAIRKALEDLKEQFTATTMETDWGTLRIEPLLEHARYLEKILRSPRFSRETARLTHGVAMFHSDLVYFKENLKALKVILKFKDRAVSQRSATPKGGRSRAARKSSKER